MLGVLIQVDPEPIGLNASLSNVKKKKKKIMEQNVLWQSGVWNTRNFSIFKTPSKQRRIFVIGGGLEKKLTLYYRGNTLGLKG